MAVAFTTCSSRSRDFRPPTPAKRFLTHFVIIRIKATMSTNVIPPQEELPPTRQPRLCDGDKEMMVIKEMMNQLRNIRCRRRCPRGLLLAKWRLASTHPMTHRTFSKKHSHPPTKVLDCKWGLQVPPSYANSPLKAWRLIFTNTILEKLVKHTNSYREANAGSSTWTPIQKKDLMVFNPVLFLMGVQKWNDKPSNWFSNNPILESPVSKRIMSGHKFSLIIVIFSAVIQQRWA